MRIRVEAAMLELDYVPNLSARALRNGRSGLIALALPDLSTPYSAEMAHHFVVAAGARGLGVQMEETAVSGERELQLISKARAHLIDGLILNPVLLPTVTVQAGVRLPPTVFIGEVDQHVGDHVWVDNVTATQELTLHLIGSGAPTHRHHGVDAVGDVAASVEGLPGRSADGPDRSGSPARDRQPRLVPGGRSAGHDQLPDRSPPAGRDRLHDRLDRHRGDQRPVDAGPPGARRRVGGRLRQHRRRRVRRAAADHHRLRQARPMRPPCWICWRRASPIPSVRSSG